MQTYLLCQHYGISFIQASDEFRSAARFQLRALLFILCINDVLELFSVRALLFADDLKSFSTVNELYDSRDLDRLFGWSLKNNLELNIS